MKALPFKIPMTEAASVRVQEDRMSHFYDQLHFHPELQFTTIIKGYGSFLVGDQMVDFKEGDVFLLGSNLPHLFKCDEVFYQDPEKGVYAISVFFHPKVFGNTFWTLPELTTIQDLLRQADRGIIFKGPASESLREQLLAMPEAKGFQGLLNVLSMLHTATAAEVELLSNLQRSNLGAEADERLGAVLQYVMDHCSEKIILEEVAAVANLSPSAFCRFFKLRTRKTFVRFLNEIRVGLACRLLREERLSISAIAYQVGFQNLSNFNRQFRVIMGSKPSDWRKKGGVKVRI